MNSTFRQHPRSRFHVAAVIAILTCAAQAFAQADPPLVRYVQGTIHGFLEMRSPDDHVVASGDIIQSVRGDRVTLETLFNFKDGSTDDETAIYSQRHTFQFISDHHIQKGPFFPHPMDVLIDGRSGQVTTHTADKDGKEEEKTSHIQIPADIANGLVPLIIENLGPDESSTTVSVVVATPKPLIAKLVITKSGEESYSLVGSARKAIHYEIKIQLTGLAGVVAPIIGKTPPDIQIWTTTGQTPTFIREQGPIYPDSPIMTIQLVSPTWPDAAKSTD
ncbi:MAG TPA: hypothetical protein VGG45_03165 [Terracidiphilus sp.]|jgi:hypothetical protein